MSRCNVQSITRKELAETGNTRIRVVNAFHLYFEMTLNPNFAESPQMIVLVVIPTRVNAPLVLGQSVSSAQHQTAIAFIGRMLTSATSLVTFIFSLRFVVFQCWRSLAPDILDRLRVHRIVCVGHAPGIRAGISACARIRRRRPL